MTILQRFKTYFKLGLKNILKVVLYRLKIKLGIHSVQRIKTPTTVNAQFFVLPKLEYFSKTELDRWEFVVRRFGWHEKIENYNPPNWFVNFFGGDYQASTTKNWWEISDFNEGDIKGVWEISRFHWAPELALASVSGNPIAGSVLNSWLADWNDKNPPYKGPNWKCGQEASIRVINLVLCAIILREERRPTSGLCDLIEVHLRRIEPTLSYAVAQQNNHASSEAAALFIGGTFLTEHVPDGKGWAEKGRKNLENCATKLIETDGGFSQYSVNYHRFMLETFSICEIWREKSGLPAFTPALYQKLQVATKWLRLFTNEKTGDAPNLGANDGAHLLQFLGSNYRDFRPCVYLATVLFEGKKAFSSRGNWQELTELFNLDAATTIDEPSYSTFSESGYHVLANDVASVFFRFPAYKFRPSQSDALHIDLWSRGKAVFSDAGSFSYNSVDTYWFASAAAHNVVEFDSRDQMRRISRFLFSDWLKAHIVEDVMLTDGIQTAAAGYTDSFGASHVRYVKLENKEFVCVDELFGKFEKARLRWRLCGGEWKLQNNRLSCDTNGVSIQMKVNGQTATPLLNYTSHSLYYQKKDTTMSLEFETYDPCVIITKVQLR